MLDLRMVSLAALLSLVGLAGCTGVNPDYQGAAADLAGGDNTEDGGTGDVDLAGGGTVDLSNGTPPDLANGRNDLSGGQRMIQVSLSGQVNNFCGNVTTRSAVLITAASAGIDCGRGATACSASVPVGSFTTLTAEVPAGTTLRWNGCQGAVNTCLVPPGVDPVTVTATLEASIVLTVTSGRNNAVSVNPAGSLSANFTTQNGVTTCAANRTTCCATYGIGTTVTLESPGQWGGACSNTQTGRACRVVMTGAQTVSVSP